MGKWDEDEHNRLSMSEGFARRDKEFAGWPIDPIKTEKIVSAPAPDYRIDWPKKSKWSCELFGMGPTGITFIPNEGCEPNWFWRWMQYLILGNKWVRK